MKKVCLLLTVVLLWATPLLAFNLNDHVTVSTNGKGDLLIYPMYIAGDGIYTQFTVINTSNTRSAVAKVVVRGAKYSQELLDFLIFLSPNDVFKAKIEYVNGQYQLTTTDGSLCLANGECASSDNPMSFPLAAPCDGQEVQNYGYIEVFEATTFNIAKGEDGTVSKQTIVNNYAEAERMTTENILSGMEEVFLTGSDYTTIPVTVLKSYGNNQKLTVGALTSLGAGSNNNLCEIESALSKENLVIPYYQGSVSIFTFPTKLSSCPDSDGNIVAQGPYFDPVNPVYSLNYYDLEEHTHTSQCLVSPCPENPELNLPDEVNLITLNSPFEEGWARAVFGKSVACLDLSGSQIQYTGSPVIPLVVHFTSDGLSVDTVAYDYATMNYNGQDVTGIYQAGLAASTVTPSEECSPNNLAACTTQVSCNGAGGVWYNNSCITSDACSNLGGSVQDGVCVISGGGDTGTTVPQCDGLGENDCKNTDGCIWNPLMGTCSLNCGQYTDETSCNSAFDGNSCQWQNVLGMDVCVPK